MTSLLGSQQHQARRPRSAWVRHFVGSVSDTKFVDEGVEFGVQNALKHIVESVYFQKCSGGLGLHQYITTPKDIREKLDLPEV